MDVQVVSNKNDQQVFSGVLTRGILLLVFMCGSFAVSDCHAEIRGGRFTPFRAGDDRQANTMYAGHEEHSEVVTVFADSVWSSAPPPVKPSTAMYHSLALAGWGQRDNGKKHKALMFIAAETVCLGGFAYLQYKLGDESLSALDKEMYRIDRNSFLLYWMIAKIYGLMDAYVDAHLATYDVSDITPRELEH